MTELTHTNMHHYECRQCEMTATVVATPAARAAWHHHMASHDKPWSWECWSWTIFPLPLD